MENNFSLRQFKPALLFIGKFLGIYVVGSLLYGMFITHYEPTADPATIQVGFQTTAILNWITPNTTCALHPTDPTVLISNQTPILEVFEGCNGLNVMIVFVAFVIAFGPLNKKLIWFIPTGLLSIHLANLLRIGLLFYVSRNYHHQLYFLHKYFFTAFIYAVVFALWFYWFKIAKDPDHAHA